MRSGLAEVVIHTIETDVLVVGAGPTGLTASIILAREGISTLTISRYSGPANTPRASVTNARTFEVYRDLGVEGRIGEVGQRLDEHNYNVLATTLSGVELGRYKSFGTPPDRLSDYAAASPCTGHNVHQMVTEPILLDQAMSHGADIRFSNQLTSIEQDADGVLGHVVDHEGGSEYDVRARYVIAADGGNSSIATMLGFEFNGQPGEQTMSNCWLDVDLSAHVSHRPGVIYWTGQPGADTWFGSGSWILVKPWNDWSFIYPLTGDDLPSEEEVIERARMTIGDPNADVKVKAITTWKVQNVVAAEYRKGRVFLAGDAAHRHPPSGGLGANTSIQDAFNLSWKLVAVLRDQAGPGLLDSYHDERQPVGAFVVDRAISTFGNLASFVSALGLKEGQSSDEGWNSINELFEDSPRATERREVLREAVRLQHYRSNAIGTELGQRYVSGAVVDDGTDFPEHARDPYLYYEPTTHPGAYLPHAWIEHDRQQVSTIDVVGHGAFSLIVGVGGAPWIKAADDLASEYGIRLNVVRMGLRCDYDDVVGEWEAVREMGDQGALLVRPDRYIAWRSHELPADPAIELEAALKQVLARASRNDLNAIQGAHR